MTHKAICRICGSEFFYSPWSVNKTLCRVCLALRKEERKKKRAMKNERLGERGTVGKQWYRMPEPIRECELCGRPFTKENPGIRDHVVPRRIVQGFDGADPDDARNLIWLDRRCHGAKAKAETALAARGDILFFEQELNRLHWDMERVSGALELYGLKEGVVR